MPPTEWQVLFNEDMILLSCLGPCEPSMTPESEVGKHPVGNVVEKYHVHVRSDIQTGPEGSGVGCPQAEGKEDISSMVSLACLGSWVSGGAGI